MNLDNMKRIANWLNIMFPEDCKGPFWKQPEYKRDLFDIFREIYSEDIPHGEMISDYLKENWRNGYLKNEEPNKISNEISNILITWDEWIYAIKNFS
jgi:hypothetical protein